MTSTTPENPRPGNKQPPLVKRKSANSEKKIGDDEFMAAAIGDVEWLKQSIRINRGSINYDKNGLAPIHLASIHGRLECLKVLIEKFKIDINLPSNTGWRPIHLVISNQTGKRAFNCLCYLLEHGADPSLSNEDGITPMHQAASEGHVQCLKALLEAGAPADGRDHRGHTPIDLAKLWSHRKCARLLAAEKWHQDKRVLAHQMDKLQKLQMQKALQSIREEEEVEAHKKFYGDIAFKEWLGKRGLELLPTGPKPVEHEDKQPVPEKRRQGAMKTASVGTPTDSVQKGNCVGSVSTPTDSVQKANSVGRSRALKKAPSPILEEEIPVGQNHISPLPKTPQHNISRESTKSNVIFSNLEDDGKPAEPVEGDTSTSRVGLHDKDWNKSTKAPQNPYVPILGDHYPHDEYTMLPKYPPQPKFPLRKRKDGDTNDIPQKGNPEADVGIGERAVVYKCKHIGDIHKKKHYDVEWLPRSEVGLHLCMDPELEIFKNSLLKPIRDELSTDWSGSNLHTSPKGKRSRSMNLHTMMEMMEQMSSSNSRLSINAVSSDKRLNIAA